MSLENKIEQCKNDIKKLEENLHKLEQEKKQETLYQVGAVFRGASCITMLTKNNEKFLEVYTCHYCRDNCFQYAVSPCDGYHYSGSHSHRISKIGGEYSSAC